MILFFFTCQTGWIEKIFTNIHHFKLPIFYICIILSWYYFQHTLQSLLTWLLFFFFWLLLFTFVLLIMKYIYNSLISEFKIYDVSAFFWWITYTITNTAMKNISVKSNKSMMVCSCKLLVTYYLQRIVESCGISY